MMWPHDPMIFSACMVLYLADIICTIVVKGIGPAHYSNTTKTHTTSSVHQEHIQDAAEC